MEIVISFFASVMANVVSYYICKWLDRNQRVVSLRLKPPSTKRNRTPSQLQLGGGSSYDGNRIVISLLRHYYNKDEGVRQIHYNNSDITFYTITYNCNLYLVYDILIKLPPLGNNVGERGNTNGSYCLIHCFYYGKCSQLLYLQMAGQKLAGSQPKA